MSSDLLHEKIGEMRGELKSLTHDMTTIKDGISKLNDKFGHSDREIAVLMTKVGLIGSISGIIGGGIGSFMIQKVFLRS